MSLGSAAASVLKTSTAIAISLLSAAAYWFFCKSLEASFFVTSALALVAGWTILGILIRAPGTTTLPAPSETGRRDPARHGYGSILQLFSAPHGCRSSNPLPSQ